jgi:glyceraldehyde 3-phosphate dehydrogenase
VEAVGVPDRAEQRRVRLDAEIGEAQLGEELAGELPVGELPAHRRRGLHALAAQLDAQPCAPAVGLVAVVRLEGEELGADLRKALGEELLGVEHGGPDVAAVVLGDRRQLARERAEARQPGCQACALGRWVDVESERRLAAGEARRRGRGGVEVELARRRARDDEMVVGETRGEAGAMDEHGEGGALDVDRPLGGDGESRRHERGGEGSGERSGTHRTRSARHGTRWRRPRSSRAIVSPDMALRIGINGLGRIGRALVRVAHARPELGLTIAAANDSAAAPALARLLRHDTVHRRFPGEVGVTDGALVVAGTTIPLSHAGEPTAIDWSAHGVECVVEATGRFRARALAAGHLGGSVRQVVVSATIPDADANFCFGLNHASFDAQRHRVVSNVSCTTHCLAATLAVIHPRFGVERALMNTVHCVTNSQNLVDMAHTDPRRARAAVANIIPTTSDAIPSVGWLLPELAGRVEGLAMRVPIVAGSLIDVVALLERPATRESLADAFRAAEAGVLAGVLGTTDEELVSSDFVDDPRSAVVDLPLLQFAGDRLARIVAWYDNEWGYTHRLAELLAHFGRTGS